MRGAGNSILLGTGIYSSEIFSQSNSSVEILEITPNLIESAQKEGLVTVRYSSPLDEMTVMANAFAKKFGIKVQIDRKVGVVGTQQFASEERAGKHLMDVNYSADPRGLIDLTEEGLYLKFSFKDIESKLDKGTYLPNIAYGTKWTEVVISYNSDHISHEKAKTLFKTWHGLLDPSLKGKIGMNEPAGGGVPFATFLMFLRKPEYGMKFLEQLKSQQPRIYPGSSPGREDLAAGAISVYIPNWESAAMTGFLKGDKTSWTYPEIAPSFSNTFLAISKKAPHSAAARLFVTWFFTLEGAKALQEAQVRSTLKGIADNRSAILQLKKTNWWKPYPPEIRWIPEKEDWITNYEKLMPSMRAALGWKR